MLRAVGFGPGVLAFPTSRGPQAPLSLRAEAQSKSPGTLEPGLPARGGGMSWVVPQEWFPSLQYRGPKTGNSHSTCLFTWRPSL